MNEATSKSVESINQINNYYLKAAYNSIMDVLDMNQSKTKSFTSVQWNGFFIILYHKINHPKDSKSWTDQPKHFF